MRGRDAESNDPAPAWLWNPAQQKADWWNRAAASLFPDSLCGAGGPLAPDDPVAALSNACHATLVSTGASGQSPISTARRGILCCSTLEPLDAGAVGVRVQLTLQGPLELGAGNAGDAPDPLLARAAHDLRAPLAAMVGFAEFMAQRGDEMPAARRREYLTDIVEAGRFAARMAEDLLTYAATEGRGAGSVADLADIARHVLRMLSLEAERRDVAIDLDLAAEPGGVKGDADQIRRALGNLAGNAVAHARRRVSISLAETQDGGVALCVADDGPGLSAAELRRALEPFGRPRRAEGDKGVGLGLPIARRFAEANGARLEIETAPDAGFVARMLFPKAQRL